MSQSCDLRVALSQMNPVLADLDANFQKINSIVDQAAARAARLVVFPELSLTGYKLGTRTPNVALSRKDTRWQPLLEQSLRAGIIAGFVLEEDNAQFYNAAAFLHNGDIAAVHKKTYLPNYRMFEEGKWFASGNRWDAFEAFGFRLGVLICEESWHISPAYAMFLQNVDLLFIIANSSNQQKPVEDETSSAQACKIQNRYYARMLGCFVCFINRTGEEEGIRFWGGSECIAPDGHCVASLSHDQEDLLLVNIQKEVIRRARFGTPLRRDEKAHLLANFLHEQQDIL